MASTTAPLLNTPTSASDFDSWSFQLDQNIRDISHAIHSQKNITLPTYQIFPVNLTDTGEWLQRISQAVDQIAQIININAVDVENVDLQDERERQVWAYSIFTELTAARRVLKI